MVYRIGIDCLQLFQLPRVPGLKTLESFEISKSNLLKPGFVAHNSNRIFLILGWWSRLDTSFRICKTNPCFYETLKQFTQP